MHSAARRMDPAILVVDNDVEGANGLALRLRALGRSVTTATSTGEAVDAVESRAFGLAVLALDADCAWRGELIAFLSRVSAPYVPVLLVTDTRDHAALLAEFAGVVDEVLVRPFAPGALAARARSLLRMHARVAKLERAKRNLRRSLGETRDHAQMTLQSLRDCAAVLEYNLRFAERVRDTDPAEACAALGDATEAAQRIIRRLESGQAIAPSSGGIEPVIRRFPLRPLVATIVRWARREALTRHLRLGWSVAARVHVEADPDLLERLLQGLVDNALRHTVSGGRIELRAESTHIGTRITVADTGILVPFAQRAALFERDTRGIQRAREGFGPGAALYLCRRIVDAHRGTIGIEDEQGWSNTFVVELPRRVRRVVRGPADVDVSSAADRDRARSR